MRILNDANSSINYHIVPGADTTTAAKWRILTCSDKIKAVAQQPAFIGHKVHLPIVTPNYKVPQSCNK